MKIYIGKQVIIKDRLSSYYLRKHLVYISTRYSFLYFLQPKQISKFYENWLSYTKILNVSNTNNFTRPLLKRSIQITKNWLSEQCYLEEKRGSWPFSHDCGSLAKLHVKLFRCGLNNNNMRGFCQSTLLMQFWLSFFAHKYQR